MLAPKSGSAAALVVVVLAGAACARPQPVPEKIPAFRQEGEASWYGPGLHGRTTASGERYDMHALTAAHPTLPFNTLVKVTVLRSGRTVVVRINDRGPFVEGRIVDLSRAAAEALRLTQGGVARVRIEVVGRAAAPAAVKRDPGAAGGG